MIQFTDEYFMHVALKEAEKAYKVREVPVGAVVVHDQRIIARAYNQVELLQDATAHAEMIALTAAGLLHGFNERVSSCSESVRGRALRPVFRAVSSGTAILLSLALASFGLVALIAKGYGSLAWIYLLIYILPLLVLGPRKLLQA